MTGPTSRPARACRASLANVSGRAAGSRPRVRADPVMDRPPTLNDVAQCYRLFLERDVENASMAVMRMADTPTLWELIRRFAASSEAARRRIHRASGPIAEMYDPAGICLDVE